MPKLAHRPYVLIILDGWGYRKESTDNAIALAYTPTWDRLWAEYPHTVISGSGPCVGLPDGQMGNSEVGHLNMGAGRVVHQDYTRIEHSLADGSFFQNPVLIKSIKQAIQSQHAIHVFGLLSPGGVHSHEQQIHALFKLAAEQGAKQIYMHAFLDGRDTPPQSAGASIQALEDQFKLLGVGQIASICGRYYAMDRDNRWDRVEQAYEMLTEGKASYQATDAQTGLNAAYTRGENDEFVKPTCIHAANSKSITIEDGDVIIFMNYRADRAREITRAFIEKDFSGFERNKTLRLADFVSLTEYAKNIKTTVVFGPENMQHTLGEYLSELNLSQLRIAETEKYAHVTFFFNGGIEAPNKGEDRILVPSPKVATYDLQPEMSAPELTEKLIAAINSAQYDVIICNYANADMVGHSGLLPAAIKAIETLDHCLGQVIPALQKAGGELLITADHGNAEQMRDPQTHQPHTAHTCEPVPLVYVGRPATIVEQDGVLADIAPTLLHLMGLPQPKEMTGTSIFAVDHN